MVRSTAAPQARRRVPPSLPSRNRNTDSLFGDAAPAVPPPASHRRASHRQGTGLLIHRHHIAGALGGLIREQGPHPDHHLDVVRLVELLGGLHTSGPCGGRWMTGRRASISQHAGCRRLAQARRAYWCPPHHTITCVRQVVALNHVPLPGWSLTGPDWAHTPTSLASPTPPAWDVAELARPAAAPLVRNLLGVPGDLPPLLPSTGDERPLPGMLASTWQDGTTLD